MKKEIKPEDCCEDEKPVVQDEIEEGEVPEKEVKPAEKIEEEVEDVPEEEPVVKEES